MADAEVLKATALVAALTVTVAAGERAATAATAAEGAAAAGAAAATAAGEATAAAAAARATLAVPILDLAASRDLAPGDLDALLRAGGAGVITVTIPPDAALAWPIGRGAAVLQAGAGAITVAVGAGVTLEGAVRTTRTQGSALSILKTAADRWLVAGDGVA